MTPDQFAQELVNAGQVPAAVAEVRRSKALAHVLEHARIVDTDGTVIDLSRARRALGTADGPQRTTTTTRATTTTTTRVTTTTDRPRRPARARAITPTANTPVPGMARGCSVVRVAARDDVRR